MDKTPYTYVLVRTDIPLADQIVQVGHACLEAGFKFERPERTPNLVLLAMKNESELKRFASFLEYNHIRFEMFFEPDDEMGFTALATEPIYNEQRSHFAKLELWRSA